MNSSEFSKFFRGDSDSETEDDDIISSDDDELDEEPQEVPATTRRRFLKGAGVESDESDEDDIKREVKSAKSKRIEALEISAKIIENAQKINDWVAIQNGISLDITGSPLFSFFFFFDANNDTP